MAIVCAALYLATCRLPAHESSARAIGVVHGARTVVGEVAVVAALYALWQYVFALTVTSTAGATEHARSIHSFEVRIGLPDELTVQKWSMAWDGLIRFLNWYYAYLHIPALGVMLVWLFFRHRDRYGHVRNVLALATGACLALQSIPVAPPRFLADLGFVDTGLAFGQSVYGEGGSGISNQLAAMPSIHVTWAVLVAGAVIWAATTPWRWLAVVHPVITTWAVVATANHWWADGIVAVGLVGLAVGTVVVADRLAGRFRSERVGTRPRGPGSDFDPVPDPPAGRADQLSNV